VAPTTLIDEFVTANKILSKRGLVDGYGHVSCRSDGDSTRYLMPRALPPNFVTPADVLIFDLDSKPIEASGAKVHGERFIHGEIYKLRPDVGAIVHCHVPALTSFAVSDAPLQPVYHMASFIGTHVPIFDVRELAGMTDTQINTAALGAGLARSLGDAALVLMRGHGVTIVGQSIRHAVYRAVYAVENAQIQMDAMRMGRLKPLAAEEVAKSNAYVTVDRAWEFWKREAEA
jgi:HCOMODA/2-hydroxy-3-carboxy-muconic semialdehyde decarboxylase